MKKVWITMDVKNDQRLMKKLYNGTKIEQGAHSSSNIENSCPSLEIMTWALFLRVSSWSTSNKGIKGGTFCGSSTLEYVNPPLI